MNDHWIIERVPLSPSQERWRWVYIALLAAFLVGPWLLGWCFILSVAWGQDYGANHMERPKVGLATYCQYRGDSSLCGPDRGVTDGYVYFMNWDDYYKFQAEVQEYHKKLQKKYNDVCAYVAGTGFVGNCSEEWKKGVRKLPEYKGDRYEHKR